uniref:Uncharacterized protein n=1 Tax=Oryza punctata TaxID=4537 RepID=A0A0E0M2Z1_ORYPU
MTQFSNKIESMKKYTICNILN